MQARTREDQNKGILYESKYAQQRILSNGGQTR